jgi:hypothetical protein
MSSGPKSIAAWPQANPAARSPRTTGSIPQAYIAIAQTVSSLPHRARSKETARGTAAVACLPSKDDLGSAYFSLRTQIDEIVAQAREEGSLQTALNGLNSVRHTLDSLSRLSGFDRQGTQVNVAVQTNVNVELTALAERIIQKFDREPELRARIAQALVEVDHEQAA